MQSHSRLSQIRGPWGFLRHHLPRFNFLALHYIYITFIAVLAAIIFWGASTPPRSVHFVDALFMTISAVTEAGLNVRNLSSFNTFQQIVLFLLLLLGSAVWVSALVVWTRRFAFERKFLEIIEEQRRLRDERRQARARERRDRMMSRSSAEARKYRKFWSRAARSTQSVPAPCFSPQHRSDQLTEAPTSINQEAAGRQTTATEQVGRERNLPVFGSRSLQDIYHQAIYRRTSGTMSGTCTTSETADAIGHMVASRQNAMLSSPRDGMFVNPCDDLKALSSRDISDHHLYEPTEVAVAGASRFTPAEPHKNVSTRSTSINKVDDYFETLSGWVARNSHFHGLSDKERERLGGHEYRAVVYLSWLVPLYYLLWQLLGSVALGAYVVYNRPMVSIDNGLNPWWTGAFMAVSAFANSGMMLLDVNMTAFQTADFPLITMSLLILAGNTCFPVFLRWIVWCLWRATALMAARNPQSEWRERRRTLRFLLDHPRRCFTHLFPARHTWWLLCSVISLNGVDWAFFEILNLGNAAIEHIPVKYRVLDGLFQAFAVRTGGFYVVTISDLRIGLQVLYVIMMYISVFPVVITMRNSNVYEERSLGIYADDEGMSDDHTTACTAEPGQPLGSMKSSNEKRQPQDPRPGKTYSGWKRMLEKPTRYLRSIQRTTDVDRSTKSRFLSAQLHAQLAHDAWWIALALFLISIIETPQFERDPGVFSIFNMLFEIVSGYGCVGISTGLPDKNYAFSGGWRNLSKLVLCAVMIRGRHRGLPVAIDMAVLLPGEDADFADRERDRWRGARIRASVDQNRVEQLV